MKFWLVSADSKTAEHWRTLDYFAMPEYNVDDFSRVLSKASIKAIIVAHDADLPPETLEVQAEQVEKFILKIDKGDVLCMAAMQEKKLQFMQCAEITGDPYAVEIAPHVWENRIPIRFQEKQVGALMLRPYLSDILKSGSWPSEIEDVKFRQAIREKLPLPQGKFARFKWLLGIVVAIQMLMMLKGMLQSTIDALM